MNKKLIGDFLFQFYRKRTSSFLAGIYKSTITGESEDIHRLRVDVKKINALYKLFAMIRPDIFRAKESNLVFDHLFKVSGKIRELQLHQLYLSRPGIRRKEYTPFIKYLRELESNETKNFLKEIRNFSDRQLKSVEKEVKKICFDPDVDKVLKRSGQFMTVRADKIGRLLEGDPGNEKVHEIRKHLKSMSTISGLTANISPGEIPFMITSGMDRAEVMIGEWHDRIVLSAAIDDYLKSNKDQPKECRVSLLKLRKSLRAENNELLRRLLPEVSIVVERIKRVKDLQEMQE